MLSPPKRHGLLAMWEQFGAHGDLHAVFDADPPQDIIDDMSDVDEILGGDAWEGGYITALPRRRGSRSTADVFSQSRHHSRVNGFRRRSTRDDGATEDGGSIAL